MNTFIANGNRCPKCGKPYVYVGDMPESPNTAGEELFCTCASKKKDKGASYYGWECPVCGMVYAPWVRKCDYCPKTSSGTTSTTVKW